MTFPLGRKVFIIHLHSVFLYLKIIAAFANLGNSSEQLITFFDKALNLNIVENVSTTSISFIFFILMGLTNCLNPVLAPIEPS